MTSHHEPEYPSLSCFFFYENILILSWSEMATIIHMHNTHRIQATATLKTIMLETVSLKS